MKKLLLVLLSFLLILSSCGKNNNKEKLSKIDETIKEIESIKGTAFMHTSMIVKIWDKALKESKDYNKAITNYISQEYTTDEFKKMTEAKYNLSNKVKELKDLLGDDTDTYNALENYSSDVIKLNDMAINLQGTFEEYSKKVTEFNTQIEKSKTELNTQIEALKK